MQGPRVAKSSKAKFVYENLNSRKIIMLIHLKIYNNFTLIGTAYDANNCRPVLE